MIPLALSVRPTDLQSVPVFGTYWLLLRVKTLAKLITGVTVRVLLGLCKRGYCCTRKIASV